jgi:glutamine synthetase
MDGAANPYLMQAAFLAAGLDGVENKRDPGDPLDINMYEEGHKVKNAKNLPSNLLDALRQLDGNKVIRAGLGDELIDAYVKLKNKEWNSYTSYLSEWERSNTLDC